MADLKTKGVLPSADVLAILNSVIESAANSILIVDPDERIVACNRKFTQLWSLPEKPGGLTDFKRLVQTLLGRIKDPAAFLAQLEEIRARPRLERHDIVELVDGRILEQVSNPRELEGRFVGRVVNYRDVSGRHRAKAALQEIDDRLSLSEMRFQAVFESAPVGISILDSRGNFTNLNPVFCAMLGYTEDEIKAMGLAGISHPDEYEQNRELLSMLTEGKLEKFQIEKRYLPRTGPPVWALLSVSLCRGPDGRPLLGIGVVLDITRERTAREELRLSEERFRTIYQATDTGIGILDPKGTILEANPALLQLLGYSTEELRTLGVKGITHPDDFEVCWAKLSQLAMGQIDHYDMEKRYIRKDGKVIWCHLIGSLGRDSKGRPMFCIGMLNDITERKLHDAEREKLLFQEWKSHQEAIKAVRLRDDFILVASHELKTPLTPLKLQVQFLKKRLLTDSLGTSINKQDLLKMLTISDEQVGRLQQLVDDMLDTSRIRAGRLVLAFSDVSLSELVQVVEKKMKGVFAASGCELTLDLGSDTRGHWDGQRIEQVLVNLLSNAAKYGSGKPVSVTTASDQGYATIKVSDHGIGISKEDQVKIFEEFERIAPVETYGGFGLGLYITRQIVLAHRGTISVESHLGEGATFIVALPQD